MQRLPLVTIADKLEKAAWLDPVAAQAAGIAKKTVPWQAVKDVLHGVPLGHPVHPLLVVVPLGAWVSAALLDALPGNERAARTLVGLGVLSAIPTALTGVTDFSELDPERQRTGVVHLAANEVAVALYTASWLARRSGHSGRGRILAYAGLAVSGAGGFLGGHLAYRQGAGVNRNDDLPGEVPEGWHSIGPVEGFPEGQPRAASLDGVELMVLRHDGGISVLADTCSHLGGPLHEGQLREGPGGLCVVCPWHGSTFSVGSGEVVHGPATAPQPSFLTRVRDGQLEVSLPGAAG